MSAPPYEHCAEGQLWYDEAAQIIHVCTENAWTEVVEVTRYEVDLVMGLTPTELETAMLGLFVVMFVLGLVWVWYRNRRPRRLKQNHCAPNAIPAGHASEDIKRGEELEVVVDIDDRIWIRVKR